MTFYNNPDAQNGYANGEHSHVSGSNVAVLQRITSPWEEDVNWLEQPTTTESNQVFLEQDTNPNQNYTLIVTDLVNDMIANPANSFGFSLKLVDETPYRILVFASSDHPNPALHPKLEIVYRLCNQLVLQPDATLGKDAFVSSNIPNISQGNSPEFDAGAWTIFGAPMAIRGLLDFDLSSIPTGATVEHAVLTLYNNPNSQNGYANGQHSHVSGSNAATLSRVLSPWNEEVTWNTPTAITPQNQIVLGQDTDPNQDYVLNVLNLVQDMVDNPTTSYGFLLKLVDESPYRLLTFASSDHPNPALHPKLEVCYSVDLAAIQFPKLHSSFVVAPNPSKGVVSFKLPVDFSLKNTDGLKFIVFDLTTKKVFEKIVFSESDMINCDLSFLEEGMYHCVLQNGTSQINAKLLLIK